MSVNIRYRFNQNGFTIVELILSMAIFPIIVIGVMTSYNSVRRAYQDAREYNEIYAVLSACPELDRALDYSVLSGTTNCYPNNSFQAEDAGSSTITYSPQLTVTNTTSLPASDPLSVIPGAKVVQVSVGFVGPFSLAPPVRVRMLITQNGLGQL
jgi:prepilin-type N-terminal cleavage/methylation domain-containing protein